MALLISLLPVLLTFHSWLITTANIFTFLACRLISSKSLATSPPIDELNTAAPSSITSTHVNPAPPCIRRSNSVRHTYIHRVSASSSQDRKSTRLNSSHQIISHAVFSLTQQAETTIHAPCCA